MSTSRAYDSLCWVHIGDLHITTRDQQNLDDLSRIVGQINEHLAGLVDFCVLPGDNADDGTAKQYALIRSALDPLRVPVHIIPGDHDFKHGSLEAYYRGLNAAALPVAVVVAGHRCLFLDAVSAGGGGPDFHLGQSQLGWLQHELKQAASRGQQTAVFVHAYPADFPRDRQAFARLLREYQVRVVDMGHTHYNELANDGTTLFATTRSTGQIEEGPVGFSIVTLTEGVANWRFKPLDSPWPFVMILLPGDYRLQADHSSAPTSHRCRILARAWGSAGIAACRCRVGEGAWQPMSGSNAAREWETWCDVPIGRCARTVTATDARGCSCSDTITLAGPGEAMPRRIADGSDADAVDPWSERHLLGTRLGPNRNGKQW